MNNKFKFFDSDSLKDIHKRLFFSITIFTLVYFIVFYRIADVMIFNKILVKITKDIETKRAELLHFIKTVGAPHIWSTYNFYLKETGCEELIPEGSQEDNKI